jgi:dienelactone hydrolase
MKKLPSLFCIVITASLMFGCGSAKNTTGTPTTTSPTMPAVSLNVAPTSTAFAASNLIPITQTLVDELSRQIGENAYALFDATMQKAVSLDQLELLWPQVELQAGAFQSCSGYHQADVSGYATVIATCEFKAQNLDLYVAFDADSKIAGLHFLNSANSSTPSFTYQAPAYVDQSSFTEREVTVGSGQWALPGTLSIPKGSGPFLAVVLVHGSGPNDRDETIGPNMPFRDIAWGLASKGIAVLRYEKRTREHANLFTPEVLKTLTLQQETIDDALLAAALLRQTPEVDPQQVYVLGHSFGALAAPRIGVQDPVLAGLIIMAAPAKPLEDIYVDQLTYIFSLGGDLTPAQQEMLRAAEAGAAMVKSPNLTADTPADKLPLHASGVYWLDLRSYHPDEIAATLTMRLLILQGGRDYQVTPDNFDIFKSVLSGRANVTFHLYPDLNHLFMSGSGPSTPQESDQPGHVAEQVISDIAAWIQVK